MSFSRGCFKKIIIDYLNISIQIVEVNANRAEVLRFKSIERLGGERYFGLAPRTGNYAKTINKQTSTYSTPAQMKQD